MREIQLLSLLILVALFLAATGHASTLQKVTLLTRNGARGLSKLVGNTVTCDTCALSSAGAASSFQLGKFIAARYGAPLLLGSRLDPTVLNFQAVDAERTIVFGQGITKGMYPESMPLVEYRAAWEDTELAVTQSWPAFIMEDAWSTKLHMDDQWALERIGQKNMATLAQFIPASGNGADNTAFCVQSPSLCATYVYDSWAVNTSEGNVNPTLQPLLSQIAAVYKRFMWRLYAVDEANADDVARGPLAGPFFRTMMTDFASNATMLRLSVNIAPMPLVFATLSALGAFTAENTFSGSAPEAPDFGEAIAFEYTTDAAGQQQRINVFRLARTPESEGEYAAAPLVVRCMGAAGNVYTSDSNVDGCVAEDLLRYVNSIGATDGQCYVSEANMERQTCTAEGAPPLGSPCYFFRANCPGAPCGETHNAIADPALGFACQDLQLNSDTPYLATTIVAIGAPALLAGSILGFYLSGFVWNALCPRKKSVAEQ